MNPTKFLRPLLILLVVSIFLTAPASRSHSQGGANVETRINALLARMTLEEKLGQLQQLDGEGNGNFRPEHVDLIRKGLLGSTFNVRSVKNTNQLQHVANSGALRMG